MIPEITNDDFTSFLRWLFKEKEYTALSIINVVESPYKFGLEYREFTTARKK
tara:strand:- start:273 stop:428 length:156 start_codon:yes stop_codon:yes gene_type:complete